MRWLGIDVGRRRMGLALSDDSALMARPWQTVAGGATPAILAASVMAAIASFGRESLDTERVDGIVIGLPRRLNGEDTDQTATVRALAGLLARQTNLPVHLQDERLTSREAESIVARDEPDWRKRKPKVDAVAAAIILQDFLDGPPSPAV